MIKIINVLLVIVITFFIVSCKDENKHHFDQQAHRGGRGLMPENTIASEKNAINYNCTLEMDLEMSKDRKIVVSHDAFFNSLFCLTPEGDTMTKEDGKSRLLYNMNYDSIAKYDVGLKPHPDFPEQKKIHAVKPLFSVLIDSVEAYAKTKNHINHYNIELKSNPKWDGKHYPSLEEYVDSVISIVISKGIASRTMIQSFDVRALRMVHKKWPDFPILYLTGLQKDSIDGFLNTLGFKPDWVSPDYRLTTPELVGGYHNKGIKVIPGVPDTLEDMQELKDMGVDGMMTDYPNLYSKLK